MGGAEPQIAYQFGEIGRAAPKWSGGGGAEPQIAYLFVGV